jgi:hypothetical protein
MGSLQELACVPFLIILGYLASEREKMWSRQSKSPYQVGSDAKGDGRVPVNFCQADVKEGCMTMG